MKTIYKLLFAGLLCFSTLTAMAQPDKEDMVAGATPEMAEPHHGPRPMCPGMNPAVDFQSVKICYAPLMGPMICVKAWPVAWIIGLRIS